MPAEIIENEPPIQRHPAIQDEYWYERTECDLKTSNELMGGELKLGAKKLTEEESYRVTAFCGQCIVRSDCLADALLEDDRYGIRGGLNAAQRKPLTRQLKRNGFLDDESWQQAVSEAEVVRTSFLEKAKRRQTSDENNRRKSPSVYKNFVQRKAAIYELLEDLPDRTYIAPEAGSIYKELGEDLGVTKTRALQLVRQLSDMGVVEKTLAEDGRKVISLRLVS